jgi:hypothetical protein
MRSNLPPLSLHSKERPNGGQTHPLRGRSLSLSLPHSYLLYVILAEKESPFWEKAGLPLQKCKNAVPKARRLLHGKNSLVQTELLVEAAHAATGVDHLLLTGKEGMALGANFNADIFLGGPGGVDSTARAANGGLLIIGMDTCFHLCSPLRRRILLSTKQSLYYHMESKIATAFLVFFEKKQICSSLRPPNHPRTFL